MVFLRKELIIILKNFWPRRSDAKGFSIEKLARKYREKISGFSSSGISKQSEIKNNLKIVDQDRKEIHRSFLLVKRGHWANRDFSEYREVA